VELLARKLPSLDGTALVLASGVATYHPHSRGPCAVLPCIAEDRKAISVFDARALHVQRTIEIGCSHVDAIPSPRCGQTTPAVRSATQEGRSRPGADAPWRARHKPDEHYNCVRARLPARWHALGARAGHIGAAGPGIGDGIGSVTRPRSALARDVLLLLPGDQNSTRHGAANACQGWVCQNGVAAYLPARPVPCGRGRRSDNVQNADKRYPGALSLRTNDRVRGDARCLGHRARGIFRPRALG
jgi:hypothetical protein